jgi:hypothetical protein
MDKFTHRQLYLWRKSPYCPLNRRQGGPQSRSGCGEEKNLLSLPEIKTRFLDCPARSVVIIVTAFSLLPATFNVHKKNLLKLGFLNSP